MTGLPGPRLFRAGSGIVQTFATAKFHDPYIEKMKHLIIATILIASSATATAQLSTTTPAATTLGAQDPVKTEMRAMSGRLKDLLAQVSQRLGAIDKRIAAVEPAERTNLEGAKEGLTASKAEIEASLTSVNTATPTNWNETKAGAEALCERVSALLAPEK